MTLIEMIGALAVLAILAAVLVPAFVRQMDKMASDQELASFKSMSDALQQSIIRNRYIPSYTNWAPVVATELGMDVADVLTNPRHQPRVFLIDPALQVGANGAALPYQQTVTGSMVTNAGGIIPPVSPRVILMSTIGQPMANAVSGVPSASDFNAIWDWNDASATPPAATLLSGFTRGEDLKVQRINLSPLFLHLVVGTYSSTGLGQYAIDLEKNGVTNSAPTGAGYESYYVRGTVLNLLTQTGVQDTRSILYSDSSYVYDQGVWRYLISGLMPGAGMNDWSFIVQAFLKSPTNTTPGAASPLDVVNSMIAFMNAYDIWALNTNFPKNANWNSAVAMQNAMMANVYSCAVSKNGNTYPPKNTNYPPCNPY